MQGVPAQLGGTSRVFTATGLGRRSLLQDGLHKLLFIRLVKVTITQRHLEKVPISYQLCHPISVTAANFFVDVALFSSCESSRFVFERFPVGLQLRILQELFHKDLFCVGQGPVELQR